MGSLVTFCSGTFSLLIFAASVEHPKFMVPNHPDLTIRVRRTSGDWSRLDTLYLKGPRERREFVTEKPARLDNINSTVIRQCDKMRAFVLNERDKIYVTSAIEDWSERLKKARPVSLPQSGAKVKETIDSIDTGERRQFGPYTARHVKGRIQFEPSPGASTPASVETVDGWYIDLPGFGCEDRGSAGFTVGRLIDGSRPQDRLQITWLGKAPRGYPIEETSVKTEAGKTAIDKVEPIEISEAPLNPSIFELPVGYRLALQTGNGGADLTKPDSIPNRAQYYWARLTFWARGLFR